MEDVPQDSYYHSHHVSATVEQDNTKTPLTQSAYHATVHVLNAQDLQFVPHAPLTCSYKELDAKPIATMDTMELEEFARSVSQDVLNALTD